MTKKFDVKELREKVLSSDDIKYDEVEVKEWDVTLPVKTLSTQEMKEVVKYQDDQIRMMTVAILHGCKTEDGEAVFEKKDIAKLEAEKAFNPLVTVANKILSLSGMDEEAVSDAKNN